MHQGLDLTPAPRQRSVGWGDEGSQGAGWWGGSAFGALTRDLHVEGSEGEHEDGGHALEKELPREPGASHIRYAAAGWTGSQGPVQSAPPSRRQLQAPPRPTQTQAPSPRMPRLRGVLRPFRRDSAASRQRCARVAARYVFSWAGTVKWRQN